MDIKKRREIVEENYSSRFIKDEKGILRYTSNNKEVTLLSILVDFPVPEESHQNPSSMLPVVLKYGNFHDLVKISDIYKEHQDVFNVKVINVPLELYKWVDIVFDISASHWVYYLLEEIQLIEGERFTSFETEEN
jgi:hypothetical protein